MVPLGDVGVCFIMSFLSESERGLDLREVSAISWGHCRHCAAGSKPVQVCPESGRVFSKSSWPSSFGMFSPLKKCGFLLFVLHLCSKEWFSSGKVRSICGPVSGSQSS